VNEPTIYDVARESGFSIKTVSRVINGEKGVRAETVARVEAAIRSLDYHPNPAAQRLGGGKLPTIGIVVDSLNDPFFGEVIAVTERRAVELGMDVLVASTGMDETRARTQVERLVRRGVAALIVAPFGDDRTARASLPDGIPVVVIDRRCGIDDKDVVRVTDHEGALEAVRHLIAHGHSRIAFLGETAEFTTVQDRLAGYTDALVSAGLSVDPELVETRCWNEEASYPLALAMLAPSDAPTAVFATTPLVGLGVLRALKRLDRQDTAVVVFGDFPLAGLMTPATTVVDQRPTALAHAAFDHLERRLDDPDAPVVETVLPTRLIPRGSGELPPRKASS
jgi:LacI family transcriptional regulator